MKNRDQIIEAATRVIARHGVKRATMNDVATEAGVARQTLYNIYANKDELLLAMIRHFATTSLAAIQSEAARAPSLGDKLDVYFLHSAIKPFEFMMSSPEAKDIIDGFNETARTALNATYDSYRAELQNMLTPYTRQIEAAGLTANDLAAYIFIGTKGAKSGATDRDHLEALLRTLKVMVVSLVGEATSGEPRR